MSKVTVSEAAFLTGKSREAINVATKNGSLASTLNKRNIKVVDIVDLEKIYELKNSMDDLKKSKKEKKIVKSSQVVSELDSQEWKEKYFEVKSRMDTAEQKIELIEKHNAEKQRIFQDQIDNLKDTITLAQEGHNRATLLLENKSNETSGVGIVEKKVEDLATKISKQNNIIKTTQENSDIIKSEKEDLAKSAKVYKYTLLIFLIMMLVGTAVIFQDHFPTISIQ